jgi:GPN-loop GTPase
LASSFPTVIAYVIDTPRTTSTSTFMSNMLYACSILYKTKLPMILVFNKTDVQDADFAKEWMTDWEAFQDALRKEEESGGLGVDSDGVGLGGGSGYMGSLLNSMCMVLEEFYKHLSVVGVSSMTGDGVDEFFQAVEEKKSEFDRDYRPELERRREQAAKEKEQRREKELGKLLKDLNVSTDKKKSKRPRREPETVSEAEDMTDEEEIMQEDSEDDEEDDYGSPSANTGNQGLQSRYQRALKENRAHEELEQDESFQRFMAKVMAGGQR